MNKKSTELTASAAAMLLGVSYGTVDNLTALGELRCLPLGRTRSGRRRLYAFDEVMSVKALRASRPQFGRPPIMDQLSKLVEGAARQPLHFGGCEGPQPPAGEPAR